MKITTVGIDLAKNVFQVHAVDVRGRAVLRKQLRRDQLAAFFVNLPPCLIGMEACASAHHWARTPHKFGHTVRLMAPQFVKPYVKSRSISARTNSLRSRRTMGSMRHRTSRATPGTCTPRCRWPTWPAGSGARRSNAKR